MTELERLRQAEKFLLKKISKYGLKCVPQRFDIIPDDRMFSLISARLPSNFSFWQFGRDYERFRTEYEHGFGGGILEVVFNLDPSRAYTLHSIPFAKKVATFAHVYGHNDFFTNNAYFSNTPRSILASASAARERFLKYESKFGIEPIEKIITAAKALEHNIDPDLGRVYETQSRVRGRLLEELKQIKQDRKAKNSLTKKINEDADELARRIESHMPYFPERDILFYIIENSPMIREISDPDWRDAVIDIISVVWEQARYFAPQKETKIMNEGWATFWHQRLMNDLLKEELVTAREFSIYAEMNGSVLANHPLRFNPYLLGAAIWESIEERWDQGRFGKDYENETDANKLKMWNTNAGLGREKIFEIRSTHNDWRFVDDFLTQEIVDKLQYYIYQVVDGKLEIVTRNVKYIKRVILDMLENFGLPKIVVKSNLDQKNRQSLSLNHIYDGKDLDDEYRIKTMEHIFSLWGRAVKLRTNCGTDYDCTVFLYDGSGQSGHTKSTGCKKGECVHIK